MRRNETKINLFFTLGSLCLALFVSCSGRNFKDSDNPEEIYTEASRLVEDERFIEATELLNEIRLRFPQSRFYPLADLKTADLYFKQESYTEAAAAYGTFFDLYPRHAEAPYALHQKILSFYNDTPDLEARDQGPAESAVQAAIQFIRRYPDHKLAESASKIKNQALVKLAKKEAYIARFYQKRNAKEAARRRWQGIQEQLKEIENLPEAQDLLKEAAKNSQQSSKGA